MYCIQCRSFLDNLSASLHHGGTNDDTMTWKPYSQQLHGSLIDLERTSRTGCSICRNVWHSWSDHERGSMPQGSAIHLEVVVDQGKPILKTSLRQENDALQGRTLAMYVREIDSGKILTSQSPWRLRHALTGVQIPCLKL